MIGRTLNKSVNHFRAGIYLFKVNNGNTFLEQCVKSVQCEQ